MILPVQTETRVVLDAKAVMVFVVQAELETDTLSTCMHALLLFVRGEVVSDVRA